MGKFYAPNNIKVGYGSTKRSEQLSAPALTIYEPKLDLSIAPFVNHELVAQVEIYTGTIPDNAELIAVGWSIQAKDNKSSANDLKAAKLRVGGRIECSTYDALYTGANSPRICTLSKSAPDNATCKGDLGSGALTVVDGKLYLVGVDSHPNDSACGGSAGYTQFTNVNNYQSFISQYLN